MSLGHAAKKAGNGHALLGLNWQFITCHSGKIRADGSGLRGDGAWRCVGVNKVLRRKTLGVVEISLDRSSGIAPRMPSERDWPSFGPKSDDWGPCGACSALSPKGLDACWRTNVVHLLGVREFLLGSLVFSG